MTVASAIVWVLGRERKALDRQMKDIERQIDRANEKYSGLASTVQGIMLDIAQLPEELGHGFVSKERFEDQLAEGRRDREGLWRELSVLRNILDRRGRREDYESRDGHG